MVFLIPGFKNSFGEICRSAYFLSIEQLFVFYFSLLLSTDATRAHDQNPSDPKLYFGSDGFGKLIFSKSDKSVFIAKMI